MLPFSHFIGIPYRPLGHSVRGANCYGLVRLVLSEVFGIDIPKQMELQKAIIRNKEKDVSLFETGFVKVPSETRKPSDVLRMRGYMTNAEGETIEITHHVGIFIHPGIVIHTEPKTGSIAERYDSPRFSWRPVQVYRYRENV